MNDATAAGGAYGDDLADVYDLMYAGRPDVLHLPTFCRALGSDTLSILEFGIGSGRLAIPLAQAGFQVTGIEASGTMIAMLHERAHDLTITALQGDFRHPVATGEFDLVLIATNTLFMVDSLEGQRQTLARAAERLAPDGRLIVETYDPHVYLDKPSPFSLTLPLAPSTLLTDTVIVDRAAQKVTQIHAISRPGTIDTIVEHSYWLTPRELDLLAESVGLTRTERYSDFERHPVTTDAGNIVSVYAARSGADR